MFSKIKEKKWLRNKVESVDVEDVQSLLEDFLIEQLAHETGVKQGEINKILSNGDFKKELERLGPVELKKLKSAIKKASALAQRINSVEDLLVSNEKIANARKLALLHPYAKDVASAKAFFGNALKEGVGFRRGKEGLDLLQERSGSSYHPEDLKNIFGLDVNVNAKGKNEMADRYRFELSAEDQYNKLLADRYANGGETRAKQLLEYRKQLEAAQAEIYSILVIAKDIRGDVVKLAEEEIAKKLATGKVGAKEVGELSLRMNRMVSTAQKKSEKGSVDAGVKELQSSNEKLRDKLDEVLGQEVVEVVAEASFLPAAQREVKVLEGFRTKILFNPHFENTDDATAFLYAVLKSLRKPVLIGNKFLNIWDKDGNEFLNKLLIRLGGIADKHEYEYDPLPSTIIVKGLERVAKSKREAEGKSNEAGTSNEQAKTAEAKKEKDPEDMSALELGLFLVGAEGDELLKSNPEKYLQFLTTFFAKAKNANGFWSSHRNVSNETLKKLVEQIVKLKNALSDPKYQQTYSTSLLDMHIKTVEDALRNRGLNVNSVLGETANAQDSDEVRTSNATATKLNSSGQSNSNSGHAIPNLVGASNQIFEKTRTEFHKEWDRLQDILKDLEGALVDGSLRQDIDVRDYLIDFAEACTELLAFDEGEIKKSVLEEKQILLLQTILRQLPDFFDEEKDKNEIIAVKKFAKIFGVVVVVAGVDSEAKKPVWRTSFAADNEYKNKEGFENLERFYHLLGMWKNISNANRLGIAKNFAENICAELLREEVLSNSNLLEIDTDVLFDIYKFLQKELERKPNDKKLPAGLDNVEKVIDLYLKRIDDVSEKDIKEVKEDVVVGGGSAVDGNVEDKDLKQKQKEFCKLASQIANWMTRPDVNINNALNSDKINELEELGKNLGLWGGNAASLNIEALASWPWSDTQKLNLITACEKFPEFLSVTNMPEVQVLALLGNEFKKQAEKENQPTTDLHEVKEKSSPKELFESLLKKLRDLKDLQSDAEVGGACLDIGIACKEFLALDNAPALLESFAEGLGSGQVDRYIAALNRVDRTFPLNRGVNLGENKAVLEVRSVFFRIKKNSPVIIKGEPEAQPVTEAVATPERTGQSNIDRLPGLKDGFAEKQSAEFLQYLKTSLTVGDINKQLVCKQVNIYLEPLKKENNWIGGTATPSSEVGVWDYLTLDRQARLERLSIGQYSLGMPFLEKKYQGAYVKWDKIVDNELWAILFHGQSLQMMKERRGIGVFEFLSIITGSDHLRDKFTEEDAFAWLDKNGYLIREGEKGEASKPEASSVPPPPTPSPLNTQNERAYNWRRDNLEPLEQPVVEKAETETLASSEKLKESFLENPFLVEVLLGVMKQKVVKVTGLNKRDDNVFDVIEREDVAYGSITSAFDALLELEVLQRRADEDDVYTLSFKGETEKVVVAALTEVLKNLAQQARDSGNGLNGLDDNMKKLINNGMEIFKKFGLSDNEIKNILRGQK